MSKRPVIAIGMDAADPVLLERWIGQGHLPNLAQLQSQGAYGRLRTTVDLGGQAVDSICSERNWVMFSTGCLPGTTGYWDTAKYHAENYQVTQDRDLDGQSLAYDFQEHKAFYDLGEDYKVALFDVPLSGVSDDFNGVELAGWGGHSASHTDPRSTPEPLLAEVHQQYGRNPLYKRDFGVWWDKDYVSWIQKAIADSAATRAQIHCDLMEKDAWDLMITVFGETHSAGHDLLHFSEADHPLHLYKTSDENANLEAYQQVDQAIGRIVAAAPEDAQIVVFGIHGISNNMADLCNMAFLPELMYRYSFPGKVALAPGKVGTPAPPQVSRPMRKTWPGEVWQARYGKNPVKRLLHKWTPSKFDTLLNSGPDPALNSPYELLQQGEGLAWMPNLWYQRLWPEMKAFALAGVAEGFIRINLKGRDRDGVVEPEGYERICDELTAHLYALTDGRTGEPIVTQVARTRPQGDHGDHKRPDADLFVTWVDKPTDVIDSPTFGRIGPLTYYRPGGHTSRGFIIAKAPCFEPGSCLPTGTAADLAPTLLDLMGAPHPDTLDGQSLATSNVSSTVA